MFELQIFDKLMSDHRDLFTSACKTSETQKAEIEKLKDYIALLESGRKDMRLEVEQLQAKNERLRVDVSRLTSGEPITLCLLDGDGCIFDKTYLRDGEAGGRRAAADLKDGITKHTELHGNLLTFLYLNKKGLCDALHLKGVCTAVEFHNFLNGFARSSEAFQVVDVGPGKEAADAKIREMFKTFIVIPQVKKVIFGGGHDGGYASLLSTAHTDGYGNKLVLLAYGKLARAIAALPLEPLCIPSLFLKEDPMTPVAAQMDEVPPSPQSTTSFHTSISPTQNWVQVAKSPRNVAPPAAHRSQVISPKALKLEIDRTKNLVHQRPRICNDFALGVCYKYECPHCHEYEMTEADKKQLRFELKTIECPGNLGCRGKECWYRH